MKIPEFFSPKNTFKKPKKLGNGNKFQKSGYLNKSEKIFFFSFLKILKIFLFFAEKNAILLVLPIE